MFCIRDGSCIDVGTVEFQSGLLEELIEMNEGALEGSINLHLSVA